MYNIILIPYRNREEHLDYFLKNSVPLLKKHLDNLKVVIVEQANDKLFNRGILLNIGFKENIIYENALYFTHDVDTNPKEEIIMNYYKQNIPDLNSIKGIYTSIWNTLGGIICFSKEPFFKINGFPNNFWGWGVEDKALQNRAEFCNINITKNFLSDTISGKEAFDIFNDNHDRQSPNLNYATTYEYELFHKMSFEKKLGHILSSGLNNLEYKIIQKKQINDFIELIKVDF